MDIKRIIRNPSGIAVENDRRWQTVRQYTQISKRLGMVSLLFVFIWCLYIVHYIIFCSTLDLSVKTIATRYAIALIFIVISAIMYAVSRSRRISPDWLIDIALIYEVVGALGIVLSDYSVPYNLHHVSRGNASWVCIWIVLFPLAVPCKPKKALIAAFLSASMAPLGMGIAILMGNPTPPGAVLGNMFLSPYAAAILAYIPARTIYALEYEIIKEREMGSYRLIKELGKGNMGEVWQGEHRMIRRPAAIKLIRPEGVDLEDELTRMIRFEREAKATASLHSPHSIDLYDYGTADDGTFFYVMELLNGFDLQQFVDLWGPLSAERVVYILLQICDSLIDSHASGLIHRDIKPANIFICKYGYKCDFVKVLDFGMVKYIDEKTCNQARLTEPDVITGTPAYMAPEMILSRKFDERIDIYALGCVAYWLLTGNHVFEEISTMNVLFAHVQKEPLPISQRINSEIPPELENIILACLEKEADNRPQSVHEIHNRLENIRMEKTWTQFQAQEWWNAHVEVEKNNLLEKETLS